MRILHLFDLFSLVGGGTVGLIQQLAAAQARHGHQVSIYTSDVSYDPDFAAALHDVRVVPFHCAARVLNFYYTPGLRAAARDLGNFDVIHSHAVRSYQNVALLGPARRQGVPYIIDSHGSLPRLAPGAAATRAPFKWLFDAAWGNTIMRGASGFVANNSLGAAEYRDWGIAAELVRIIPHAFDAMEYAVLPPPGSFRRRYDLGTRPLVLSMCRIHRIKGLDFLLEAFAGLKQKLPDAALAIVGPDEGYRASLEARATALGMRDSLIFTGFIEGEAKLGALADADVFVQPSRYEHAAWVVFEAVLCGTPVIATAGSGSGEDVRQLEAGYLVRAGDTVGLTEQLGWVLKNTDAAAELTRVTAARIRRDYTIDRSAAEYDAWYRECIARGAAPKGR